MKVATISRSKQYRLAIFLVLANVISRYLLSMSYCDQRQLAMYVKYRRHLFNSLMINDADLLQARDLVAR